MCAHNRDGRALFIRESDRRFPVTPNWNVRTSGGPEYWESTMRMVPFPPEYQLSRPDR
jgi:hypothetical protein